MRSDASSGLPSSLDDGLQGAPETNTENKGFYTPTLRSDASPGLPSSLDDGLQGVPETNTEIRAFTLLP